MRHIHESNGNWELNMGAFVLNLTYEVFQDAFIAGMSHAEMRVMHQMFGKDHVLNNMMGNLSTWAKRLGTDGVDYAEYRGDG